MSGTGGRRSGKGSVRIIGGIWRGRKLSFAAIEGLRPTGDRIRETLFNWLTPHIAGARCLDLFAGSGALGMEALSRGVDHCDFVDSSALAIKHIQQHLKEFGGQDRGSCHVSSAQSFLQSADRPYEFVFLDPPFKLQLTSHVCALLSQRRLLVAGGFVYVEKALAETEPAMPPDWMLYRDKASGAVSFRLYRVGATQRTS